MCFFLTIRGARGSAPTATNDIVVASTMSRLRVVYLAGAGDAFHTFREWKDGRPDRKSSHVTYSSQFYDVCREFNADALVLCSNRNAPDPPLTNGSITLA